MPGEAGKCGDDMTIDVALEIDHQVREALELLPAPGGKFSLVLAAARPGDVDLRILALEAEREPLLRLPAVLAAPRLRHQLGRQVVIEPTRRGVEERQALHGGLFIDLTENGALRLLIAIEAALRHPPPPALTFPLRRLIGTAAEPHQS